MKYLKSVLLLIFAITYNSAAQHVSVFEDGLLDDVTPKGWLMDFLQAATDVLDKTKKDKDMGENFQLLSTNNLLTL